MRSARSTGTSIPHPIFPVLLLLVAGLTAGGCASVESRLQAVADEIERDLSSDTATTEAAADGAEGATAPARRADLAEHPMPVLDALAAGEDVCGVSAGGAVVCWAPTADRGVAALPDVAVRAADAGPRHGCAVTEAGGLVCWTLETSSHISDDADSGPITVVSDAEAGAEAPVFADVSVGLFHTCALTEAGRAYCWGQNGSSQLGNPEAGRGGAEAPTPVAGGHTFTALDVGYDYTCGLAEDGRAYCWGGGGIPSSREPEPVSDRTFTALAVGASHACAVGTDGAAYCWGVNQSGQLGLGRQAYESYEVRRRETEPRRVAGDASFTTLAAGENFTCGLTEAGAALCWGSFLTFDPQPADIDFEPTAVMNADGYNGLAAGAAYACGLASGQAECWGLLDGNTQRMTPVPGPDAALLTEAMAAAEPAPSIYGDAAMVVKRRAEHPNRGLHLMAEDGTLLGKLEGTDVAGRPAWSPDGDRLAFRSGDDIHVMHRGGRVDTLPRGHWPTWSPDGSRLAYHHGGDIHVVELETGEATCLGPTRSWEGYPAWLSDGRLAFATREYTGEAGEAFYARNPLPDSACAGRAYEPNLDADAALGILDPETGDARMLEGGGDFVLHLAASPVAPALTYMAGGGAIAVLHPDSAASRVVVERDGLAQYPRFGPEGRRIAFMFGSPGDIWVVDTETGETRRLTDDDVYDDMVDWR